MTDFPELPWFNFEPVRDRLTFQSAEPVRSKRSPNFPRCVQYEQLRAVQNRIVSNCGLTTVD
jgi:hypothetical protein